MLLYIKFTLTLKAPIMTAVDDIYKYFYTVFQTKLDYQVSICSLIPPATAISETQDRADMSVWWKLPFSIFFIIYYVQSAIINKVY